MKTFRFSGSAVAACLWASTSLLFIGAAQAKAYKLDELLEMARKGNPGLAANAQVTAGVQAQALEAHRSYFPTGDLSSTLAPVPRIQCFPSSDGIDTCARTNFFFQNSQAFDAITNLRGVFTRTDLKIVQPLYTFGKISAGIDAAELGVEASRSKESGQVADVELNVRRAYWGAKLAREMLSMLDEGLEYLSDAQKKIDEELAEGSGNASVTDRLRLRTMRADIEARALEARRGADLAKAGLRTLIGPGAPADLEVDDAPLETQAVPARELASYNDLAHSYRPEVKALEQLVATKRALADLEWRRQYPDLVLVGTATYAYASSIDHPQNAFANNPFNTSGVGLAAALRMPLDLFVKNAHAHRLRSEAREAELRRNDALGGIGFEVEKAYTEMKEAEQRLKTVQKGEKAARQWIAAIMQNISVGLAETKDFSDALLAFFGARVRCLQGIYDHNIAVASLTRVSGVDVTKN
ncbi:MAG TPA: TolC family protein [Polyangia bacterium]|jgi:Outer membrane protein|nr:TolC family protein [Polyangia bacterium]